MGLALASVAACSSTPRSATPAAANLIAADQFAMTTPAEFADYQIGPMDKLRVSVFQVPDLSFDEVTVDTSGQLNLPLVGSIAAAGMTPDQLSQELRSRLATRYIRDPQVSVTIVSAASQKVTVDGAVTRAGVYEMRGRTTLMQAVAMASGAVREADLKSVAVFRTVAGRRMVAVFDLAAIRRGDSEDPVLKGDDVVVVDTSRLSVALRDIIQALPGLAVFSYL